MTKQNVLDAITEFTGDFPREALREIQRDRESYIPELLKSLEYAYKNASALYNVRSDYFLHIYAIHLLAEFRERQAFPLLIKLLLLPDDEIDYILGDNITDGICYALFCTYDSEYIQEMLDVVENTELNEWARNAVLCAYELLIRENVIAKDDAVSYLRSLIYDKLPPDDSDVVFTRIVGCVIHARLFDMIPDVRFLYDNNRVDIWSYGDYDSFLDYMFGKERETKAYIDDAVKSMEWWACFKKEEDDGSEGDTDPLSDVLDEIGKGIVAENKVEHKQKKIGRNEPCPCGSGKKYKKCCLDAERNKTPSAVARVEDIYNLLDKYPEDSELFMQMYEKEAIEIDKLVYKALHHRSIPMWVKRDYEQERIGKIRYLNDALALFVDKCRREKITSFSTYDERFMVHYRSSEWVPALIDFIEEGDDSASFSDILKNAKDIIREFDD